MMQLKSVDLKKTSVDALIIPVCEDKEIHNLRKISSLIKKAKSLNEFAGKKDDLVILYNLPGIKAERVIYYGLGKLEEISLEALRAFAGKAAKESIKKKLSNILIAAPVGQNITRGIKAEPHSVIKALLEGACLGNHIFDKYKKEKKLKPVTEINLLLKPDAADQFKELPEKVEILCNGTIMAREWISTPSNDKRPEQFTESIVTNAEKVDLKIEVLDETQLKQKKFGAMLAVAEGSQSKPSLICLEYSHNDARKTIVLVGKGVTFDSGGINLKPQGSLEEMKMDMSGAAAVAATMITIAKLKPELNVVGVIPVVENMPSGNAARPGDIVKSYNGKTVEIGNTDAEGRLILIDAVSYSIEKYKPEIIIDIATLTGACVVALGEKIAGIFASDDELAEKILQSGQDTNERCWRLPLPDDYQKLLKSDFADIHNISNSRWGGAITAALFLKDFTDNNKWAHIDIAGPAYIKKEEAYCGPGGTGFGVRLFCDLLEKLS